MQKRTVSFVTIEPLSSSNIQIDCDDDTKLTATIPVACTNKAMYRIDEPVIIKVSYKQGFGGFGLYAVFYTVFHPNGTNLLSFQVNETLSNDKTWNYVPKVIFDEFQKSINNAHEICGGKLCVMDAEFHPIDSNERSFKTASALLARALQADWANGTDEEITKIIWGK